MTSKRSFDKTSTTPLFSRAFDEIINLTKGEGIYVWDTEGRRYIDGSSGPVCVTIGHGVKEVKDAVIRQMENISYAQSAYFTSESVLEFAKKLSKFTPEGVDRVYFCSGGSEATEAAAKMARQFHLERGEPTRYKVIARWQSYHGNTLGALSMSGNIARRSRYYPMLVDFPHIPPAYCYRCWFGLTRDKCNLECAWSLDKEIRANGSDNVSAFIAEPIVGATLGTVPAPEGYFQVVREICDEHDVLFIVDEVMTGLGRTGKNWGINHWKVKPDIIATAKGLSGGYLPLGACIASDKVFGAFKGPFAHGHTYGSHPVACAAGVAVLEYLEKFNLVKRSEDLGKYLHRQLKNLYDHPSIGDIRGMGLFAGIEFVKDKESKETFPAEIRFSRNILKRCIQNGLFIYPGNATVDGKRGDHIQVAPPLIVTKEQIDEIILLLDKSIGEAESEML